MSVAPVDTGEGEGRIGPMEGQAESLVAKARDVIALRWRGSLAVGLATFLGVQGLSFLWPGTFAAQARLLIQKPRSSVTLGGDPGLSPTVVSAGVTEEEVNSEIAILTSQEVLAATVAAAGLDKAQSPWYLRLLSAPLRLYDGLYARYQGVPEASAADRAVQALGRAVTAERAKASNILVVTLESRHPAVAEGVLRELLKNYFRHHVDVVGRHEMAPLFTSQAGAIAGRLEDVEESLQKAKQEGGTVDPAAERDVQLKIDATLREESETLQRRLAELNGKLRVFGRQSEQVRVREARVALENERTSVEAERVGVSERMRVLEEQLKESRQRLMDLDKRTVDANRTKRRARALEERYLTYLSRSEQARIDTALDEGRITDVSLVQDAHASPKPVRPKRLVVLAVSLLGGFLLALLWCFWWELRGVELVRFLDAVVPRRP